MPLFGRPDGTLAKDIAPYRRMMPLIMPTRTQSAVYFEQEMDLTKTNAFIEQFNASHEKRITVFHVFLWAVVQSLNDRPGLNRFTVGGHIYQRDGIWVSYSAKKELADGSPIVVLKRRFDPAMTFDELVNFVQGDVKLGKSDHQGHQEKEVNFSLKLPNFMVRIGLAVIRWLDGMNLLPAAYIKPDPMYASVFIANLGSVKLESAFHHLYEYGNIPLFAALGKRKQVVVADEKGGITTRSVCSIKWSFDERTEDGLYCAKGLELLRKRMEDPVGTGAGAPAKTSAAASPA